MGMLTRGKIIDGLITLCVLVATAYVLSSISGYYYEKTNGPLAQELRQQLLLFPLLHGDTDDDPIEILNHGGPVAAIRNLQSTHAVAEIAEHYRSQMEARGWKLIESGERANGDRSFKYCQNATGFNFSVWKYAGKTGYRIALFRNGKNSGVDYCSDKP